MSFETFKQEEEKKTEKTHFIPEILPDEDKIMKLSQEQFLDLSSEDLKRAMEENKIKGIQFNSMVNFMTPNDILILKRKMENPPNPTK